MFDVQDFGNSLQSAVAGSNQDTLPSVIYTSLTGWLRDSIWPFLIGVAVVATLLFTFYGAFLYFTAYGDENKATQAKKSITYAIVGFIITLLAWTISSYVQNIIISDRAQQELTAPMNASTPTP